jgi:hypothetical protein
MNTVTFGAIHLNPRKSSLPLDDLSKPVVAAFDLSGYDVPLYNSLTESQTLISENGIYTLGKGDKIPANVNDDRFIAMMSGNMDSTLQLTFPPEDDSKVLLNGKPVSDIASYGLLARLIGSSDAPQEIRSGLSIRLYQRLEKAIYSIMTPLTAITKQWNTPAPVTPHIMTILQALLGNRQEMP